MHSILDRKGSLLYDIYTGKNVGGGAAEALSTSCSKFSEKLLVFKKVVNLIFNHAHIHWMIIYSMHFGPNERFFPKK